MIYSPELHEFATLAKHTTRMSKYSIKRNHPLTVLLYKETSFLPSSINICERLYYVEHQLTSIVLCSNCNTKKANFVNRQYNKYCTKCSASSHEKKTKIKNTMQKNHGVDFYVNSPNFKSKRTTTMNEKYGVDHNFQSEELYNKFKNTMNRKYGVTQSMRNPVIKQKLMDANTSNNGGCGFGSVENWVTNQKNISDTGEKALIELYYNIHHDANWLAKTFTDNNNSISKTADSVGVSRFIIRSALVKHKIIESKEYVSWLENDINNYVRSIMNNTNIISNSRSIIPPKELDIYIPDFHTAIEINGLYWHSFIKNDNKNYHIQKTDKCASQGISLLHIFENEWNDPIKQDIWKSMISHRLHQSHHNIYARSCTLCEVSHAEQMLFFNTNHLQGHVNSSVNVGLRFKGELVALMTFAKSRFNRSHQWELLRFCNRLNTNVIGGAGKCFHKFKSMYPNESVISYANMRYSIGNMYKTLGFKFIKNTPPNYFYFKYDTMLISRMKFQKHKLSTVLDHFDNNLTEWQNMRNHGWNKIYDCGNQVWSFIPVP